MLLCTLDALIIVIPCFALNLTLYFN